MTAQQTANFDQARAYDRQAWLDSKPRTSTTEDTMQIDLPASLTAEYYGYSWDGDSYDHSKAQVVVRFGDEPIARLEPVREFETNYDTAYDEEQEQAIANETLAAALVKLFALLEES